MSNEEYGNRIVNDTNMTLRERLAESALRGLCANSSMCNDIQYPACERIGGMAMWYAEYLIAELNKERTAA